ncbi:CHAT domain-containing protein [Sandaracinobacter sp. RS1-74]|uniref:CHAT domain-containing protein n=1 Tax=Sandaracinobacteroides sayramensis TaxID=2913411 RepID=UPI001EDA2C61|nr:CHAT domain-containing protein [Sandaracinobacteroides sayramensis]MCG2839584.1 CHAT domain-containing protein [Sandaracinobacteroides sayramensis]
MADKRRTGGRRAIGGGMEGKGKTRRKAADASARMLDDDKPPGRSPSILELDADAFGDLLRADASSRQGARPAAEAALDAQLAGMVPPEELAALKQLAAQSDVRSRSGPRVLILPGILGSQLAVRKGARSDLIWIDPWDIVHGKLGRIGMDATDEVFSPGVIGISYWPLRQHLRLAGFNADFHPFDWRLDIGTLADRLLQSLAQERGPVMLVAHSMGGLVARVALGRNRGPVTRLVTLGSPQHGSFAVTRAFDQSSDVVQWLDRVDGTRDARGLAQLFAAFQGLVGMLPDPDILRTPDFTSAANWPASIVRPSAPALAAARALRDSLPAKLPGAETIAIVGTGQSTAVGAATTSATGRIDYFPGDGDGTVPTASAAWKGADRIWYVQAEHARMPLMPSLARAVTAILRGQAPDLDSSPPPPTAYRMAALTQALPRPDTAIADEEALLRAISPFIATAAGESAANIGQLKPKDAAAPALAATPLPRFRKASRARFSVGAGAPLRLEIQLRHGNLLDCAADCFALGLFNGIDPAGAAAAVDAELDGALRRMLQHRMFSANVGEVGILPNGGHLLRARAVAFVGLGAPASFATETMDAVGASLMRTMIAAGLDEMAMVPLGTSTAHWTEDSFGHLLQGFITAFREQPGNRFRSVTFCDHNPDRIADIREWLRTILTSQLCEEIELVVEEGTLVERQRSPARQAINPRAYLFLTQRPGEPGTALEDERRTHAALILPRPTAAAAAWQPQPASPRAMESLLDELDSARRSLKGVQTFGAKLAEMGLPPDVGTTLAELGDTHLAVVHGEYDSPIPWETLHVEGAAPALKGGLSHRYLVPNRSIAKWNAAREKDSPLRILLVADPTTDLPGAMREADALVALAAAQPGSFHLVKELRQGAATLNAVLQALTEGGIDVLHYAGHAYFDRINRNDGGLQLSGGQVFTGRHAMNLGKLPALIFFNACEAARVRGEEGATTMRMADQAMEQSSVAEVLLRNGVGNFVGTYWKVGDSAACMFANSFYRAVAAHESLNAAVLAGRRALLDASLPDWANYVFYGDPDFTLLERE